MKKEAAMADEGPIKAGTAGGILLVLLNISSQEILKTAVLATIGSVVSFTVSLLFKAIVKKLRNR
jgi:hypothetical protein